MVTLEAAGVEIYRPEKSPFATSSESVIVEFSQDPVMKQLVDEISGQ